MKRHAGSGRELWDENFSKEIFLKVNLPPLHVLERTFIPEVAQELRRTKEFVRRTTRLEKLVRGSDGLSASVKNYRVKTEASSKLPLKEFM